MKYNYQIYQIKCITNLHVGSGENNYGIVDKQIQRDPIDLMPMIHSSSYKGALREFFKEVIKLDPEKIKIIFGSENKKKEKLQRAAFNFFDAHLLSIPIRGIHESPYYKSTSQNLIDKFKNYIADFDYSQEEIDTNSEEIANTEYGNFPLKNIIPQLEKIAFVNEDAIKKAITQLPIVARNYLDNGESKNLWYEEIIPKESQFYFAIAYPEIKKDFDFKNDFEDHLLSQPIQIGANATVGYGLCKIIKI